ncbi:hypothetical protein TNCV_178921 [Trichonephila clavipes]|nr:hypothetical protein TNCV_178921 [Trichonephila clavipes]
MCTAHTQIIEFLKKNQGHRAPFTAHDYSLNVQISSWWNRPWWRYASVKGERFLMLSCDTFCQAFTSCCSKSATFWSARIWRPTLSQKCSIGERPDDLAGQGIVLTARRQRYASGMEPDIILLENGPRMTCH